MWQLAGKDYSTTVTFRDARGTAVAPDTDSVYLTVMDNIGGLITDDVQQTVTGNQLAVTVLAADNALTGPNVVENRFIKLRYKASGIPCEISDSYQLTSFIPMTANVNSVRGMTGLTPEELPDGEVDLYQAYYTLADYLTNEKGDTNTLVSYLTSGTTKSLKANQLIAIQAALDIAPGIPNRIAATQKTENAEFTRNRIDVNQLVKDLRANRESLITQLLTTDLSTIPTKTIFVVTQPTDPVTGA